MFPSATVKFREEENTFANLCSDYASVIVDLWIHHLNAMRRHGWITRILSNANIVCPGLHNIDTLLFRPHFKVFDTQDHLDALFCLVGAQELFRKSQEHRFKANTGADGL